MAEKGEGEAFKWSIPPPQILNMATFQPSMPERGVTLPVSFLVGVSVSLGFHLLLLTVFFIIGSHSGAKARYFSTNVIDVDLVSLPVMSAGRARKAVEKHVKSSTIKSPSRAVIHKPSKRVSVVSVKRGAGKTTPKKDYGRQEQSLLSSAIKNIEKKVEAEERDRKPGASAREDKKTSTALANGHGPGEKGGAAGDIPPLVLYNQELKFRIWRNWVCPQAAGNDLKAVIAIHIGSDGSLLALRFEKGSGNSAYDESARRAVLKSAPFPPLPEGVAIHKVILEFTPSDTAE